jgi:hypothetical protein
MSGEARCAHVARNGERSMLERAVFGWPMPCPVPGVGPCTPGDEDQ